MRTGARRAAGSALVVALAVLFAAGCSGGKKKEATPRVVDAAEVSRGSIAREVMFTGNIVAKDYAEVFSRAHGRVSKKLLKEGDPVKKGEAILTIDRDEVGYSFKPLALDSPIDGFVGAINVDVGSYVYDRTVFNASPVAVVVRPGPMRVKLDVPERYLDSIVPGTEVAMVVDTLGGAEYTGKIVTQSPVVDDRTRTANVELEVENADGRLRHGMFGRMKLVVERRDDVLSVPLGSVSWEGEKTIVYRLEGGEVRRVEVKPGLRNSSKVEIAGGVSEGDRVVVGGLIDLENGEKVEVRGREAGNGERGAGAQ